MYAWLALKFKTNISQCCGSYQRQTDQLNAEGSQCHSKFKRRPVSINWWRQTDYNYNQSIIGYNKVTLKNTDVLLPILLLTKQGEWDGCYSSSTSAHRETDSDTGGRPQAVAPIQMQKKWLLKEDKWMDM